MKNEYVIEGNVVKIFLSKNERYPNAVTLIDLEDFDKINKFKGTFYAAYNRVDEEVYAQITIYLGLFDGKPKYKIIRVHRVVMDCTEYKCKVDHIDQNGLDNRKSNLRISSNSNNLKNRETRNKNNKSGIRNMCWMGKYLRLQLQIDGENYLFPEKFTEDQYDEAKKFAEDMRNKYYKEFKGNN